MAVEIGENMHEDNIGEQVSDELYERLTLVVDKGQEPLRIDKFILNRVV
ncbi:MAG: hypothetical protein RLZZ420_2541, partial [Bacteroidota bacterium]